jgi:hypothetical protein
MGSLWVGALSQRLHIGFSSAPTPAIDAGSHAGKQTHGRLSFRPEAIPAATLAT